MIVGSLRIGTLFLGVGDSETFLLGATRAL